MNQEVTNVNGLKTTQKVMCDVSVYISKFVVSIVRVALEPNSLGMNPDFVTYRL